MSTFHISKRLKLFLNEKGRKQKVDFNLRPNVIDNYGNAEAMLHAKNVLKHRSLSGPLVCPV